MADKQEEMIRTIEAKMKSRTCSEWTEFFADDDICFAPVLNLQEMSEHPQVKARNMIMTVENFKDTGKDLMIMGNPIKLSDTPAIVKNKFAEIGQNTDEILQQLGYSRDAIDRLRAEKAIK